MTGIPWPPHFETLLRSHLPQLDEGSPITPDLDLGDYGLDSLATINLLLDLEETYAVSIPDDLLTATNFSGPANIWAVLAQLDPKEPVGAPTTNGTQDG